MSGPLTVFFTIAGRPDLLDDPRFKTLSTRLRHIELLYEELGPAAYSKTPGAIRRLPPRLGEHSVEILRAAGLSPAEIDALLASGATRTGRE